MGLLYVGTDHLKMGAPPPDTEVPLSHLQRPTGASTNDSEPSTPGECRQWYCPASPWSTPI